MGNSREIKGRFGVIELRFHEVPALDSLTNDEVPLRDSLTAAGSELGDKSIQSWKRGQIPLKSNEIPLYET